MAKIALVTGGNRGLGYGVMQALCEKLGPDATIYLGAREPARGEEAAARLRAEGHATAQPLTIDVASGTSVATAAALLQQRHGGLDILVGNAAMMPGADQAAMVDDFINTNNLGTHRLIRHFGPILRDGARFLIVASRHGVLTGALAISKAADNAQAAADDAKREEAKVKLFGKRNLAMADANRDRFVHPGVTLEDIEAALRDYATSLKRGTAVEDGWPDWINRPSKFGQVASMLVFARDMEAQARRRDILINACCPGVVATDYTRSIYDDLSLAQTPREAAENLAITVTLPPGTREPYGRMLFGREPVQIY